MKKKNIIQKFAALGIIISLNDNVMIKYVTEEEANNACPTRFDFSCVIGNVPWDACVMESGDKVHLTCYLDGDYSTSVGMSFNKSTESVSVVEFKAGDFTISAEPFRGYDVGDLKNVFVSLYKVYNPYTKGLEGFNKTHLKNLGCEFIPDISVLRKPQPQKLGLPVS